ncbi:MAG: M20 family metallo-hydrolase [Candidatus Methanomethylophilaceae archaeon]|jgi:succinyl-diaminopimelate desuccinylase|nr:M20 family metallo-hydrolase [Candidatus Methanomethylophilaceae archaeon]NLF33379.1 M20 family metallo-hydrolase [Thermoplasmatales archaeon]
MTLEEVLESIEASRDEIVSTMVEMIGIPALAPINGGEGEGKRADMLMRNLQGYDSVIRVDVPDVTDPSVMRPNILASKKGKERGTVWIVAHTDTVPAGDPEDWDTPPYEGHVRDGRIYGRGTEDNGQAVISSMFASKFIPAGTLTKRSLGIAYVADEETTSLMGISHLIDHGYFDLENDVVIVPDWGVPGGTLMDVAEKHLLWVKVAVRGKTTHASTPHKGLNAFRVSSALVKDLLDRLEYYYDDEDPLFEPPMTTFEPTRSPSTVENVNTIPGYAEFSLDIRLIPRHDPDEVFEFIRSVATEHAESTGASIEVTKIQRTYAGKPSSTDTPEFRAIAESIQSVIGGELRAVGVGGNTCANFFRMAGMDAYVWECGGGTLHAPNEYAEVDNIITDAKAFATVFHRLCV